MMLKSYLPDILRRYAIAGLAIGSLTALVFWAVESYAGVHIAQAAIRASISPLALALGTGPAVLALFLIAIGLRNSRLAKQLAHERANVHSLRQAAYHDNLTGLRNRHALSEDVAALVADSAQDERVAVMLFDLDRFKSINDTLGHGAGDQVLRVLTRRIERHCGGTQQVYRLGGDEFVVLWKDVPNDAAIGRFCTRLAEAVFTPVDYGNVTIDTAGSIGVAVMESGTVVLSDLLKRADLALYRAKETAGPSHCFYTDSMDSDYRLRRDLETDMRNGLSDGAFGVDYLPIYEAGSPRPVGFTAHLKWAHPLYGDVAPKLFMAMAEQSGLVVMLGKWMLGQVLDDAANWRSGIDVTLPVSPAQLATPGFAADVAEALSVAGVAPSRLVCDVFCNAISADDRIAMTEIDTLRRSGVWIAVSDFSAGIAGLAMNRVHPIDRVRLDTDHIKAIAGEARFVQMLSLFLQLASTVDIPVTLTGVDSRKDLECAISAGAVEVEGCFAGPALSATEVRELTSVGAAASGDGRMQLAS